MDVIRRLLISAATVAPAVMLLTGAVSAQPAAPTNLRSPSATSSAVSLAWEAAAGPFQVERKSVSGTFVTLSRSTESAYTDTAIEQLGTYTYRVRAIREVDSTARPGTKDLSLSPPSNEITVGPPPVGFSVAFKAPPEKEGDFASHLAVAPDANGDPAVAYNLLRAEGPKAHLFFVAWDRARYRWKAPVRVAVSGEVDSAADNVGVSLARDASSNLFVLAFQTGEGDGRGISLATSKDGGATWMTEVVRPTSDPQQSHSPSVAAAGGTIHLSYWHVNDGIRYGTRGAAGPFTSRLAPVPENSEISRTNSGVVLDGAGKPAVFYWYNSKDGPRSVVAYWRPDQPSAVDAAVSESGSDDGFASLAFSGTSPRLMVNVRRSDNFEELLWFTSSVDGRTWAPLVKMPLDKLDFWNLPLSLVIDSKGRAAATATITSGRGADLGRPKMLRSDDLKLWRVSSPDSNRLLMGVPTIGQLLVATNDKLYLAFINNDPGRKIPAGINVWREP